MDVAGCSFERPRGRSGRFARAIVLAGLLSLIAVRAAPASAHPRVEILRGSVEVETPGAVAVITRAPFRITFLDRHAHAVLSEVGNTTPGPKREPTTTDPFGPGFDNPAAPPVYAPLSFTVGTQKLAQYEGGIFGGNLMGGTRSGTRYSATRVLMASRQGNGARLVVATSDPAGRRLIVVVAPEGTSAIRITARFDRPAGVSNLSDSFASGRDEGFFGFGGRHNALDQHGNLLSSFVEEENVNGTTGFGKGGDGRSLYPNGPSAAYYPQAEFVSSHGYGFLLNTPSLARFRMDSDRAAAWNVEVSGRSLDYVFTPGTPATAIGTLTRLRAASPFRRAGRSGRCSTGSSRTSARRLRITNPTSALI